MTQRMLSWGLAPSVVGGALALHSLGMVPPRALLIVAAALALALGGLALRGLSRCPSIQTLVCLLALALVTWAWSGWRVHTHLASRLPADWEGVPLVLRGTIDELPTRTLGEGYRFTVQVEHCARPHDAAPCPVRRVALTWHERRAKSRPVTPVPLLRPGQRWQWVVRLKRPHALFNPGVFDRELRNLQEGLDALGSVREGEALSDDSAGWARPFERLRTSVRDRMMHALGTAAKPAGGVLVALAMGDQAAIAPAWWTIFNRTGVGHLISISGLHITMLAAMAGAAAGWCWRRPWVARWGGPVWLSVPAVRRSAAVLVAWCYALLAGWGIPAQRTCLMLTVAMVLVGLGRAQSILTPLGCAAAVVVWFDPWAPLAAGFWLSFGAVLAIVWAGMGERFDQKPWQRFCSQALSTQWAATLSLVPWGAWFFGAVSWVGPLANAFAIPLVSGLIAPMALLGGAVAVVSVKLAAWVLWPARWLTDLLMSALAAMSAWPQAAWPMAQPSMAALVLAALGCLLTLAPRGVPKRLWGSLACLPLLVAATPRPASDELWISALDVGQGTAVVVQVADRVLLYDTGPTGAPGMDSGTRVVLPWLRSQGIRRLDAVVISHQDDDHVGGAASVLAGMPPDWLASSLPPEHAVVHQAARHYPCRRGEHWRWGSAHFEWLHPADPPEPARGSPSNALSCVLKIVSPAGAVLLTGDIEAPQEQRLLELYDPAHLRAEVLVVPHHGSKTSSTEAFLDAVQPRWAVFQAAYRSRYGHPHPQVLARYTARGIGVLRSDAAGAVTLRMSPTAGLSIQRSRQAPARYWRVPVSTPN